MKKMMKFAAMAVAAIALCVACEPAENETLDMSLDGKQYLFTFEMDGEKLPMVWDFGVFTKDTVWLGASFEAMYAGIASEEEIAKHKDCYMDYFQSAMGRGLLYKFIPDSETSGLIQMIPSASNWETATERGDIWEMRYCNWNGKTLQLTWDLMELDHGIATVSSKKLTIMTEYIPPMPPVDDEL